MNELLSNASIASLQSGYRDSSLSVSEVTQFYLERIAELNPSMNAVISINPEAMATAKTQDEDGDADSHPLFGIPVLIKDNIETRELPTTAGSLALKDNVTNRDAPVVAQLRNMGAIILGKTNLSEWAFFRATKGSSGWSAVGGQARNPHNLDCTPSGSSSGSATSVAASLCVCSVGTETLGSIISPAAACGVVGIKPSVDLLSQKLIVPISHNQDTAGPFGRSVADAALMLSCMNDKNEDFHSHLATGSLDEKRLGIIPFTMGYNENVDRLFRDTLSKLTDAGAISVEDIIPAIDRGTRKLFLLTSLYEFKQGINDYLSSLPNELNQLTLSSLIQFNNENASTEMPFFGQDIFEMAEDKGSLTETEYVESLAKLHQPVREGIDQLFADHNLDAVIAPTMGPAFKIDHENGDGELGGGLLTGVAAIAGYPHITIPMGKIDGLPVGFSIVGKLHDEAGIIAIAHLLEQLIDYDSTSPI